MSIMVVANICCSVYRKVEDLHSKLRSEVIDQLSMPSAGQPSGASRQPRPGDRREPDGGEDPLKDTRPARRQQPRDLLVFHFPLFYFMTHSCFLFMLCFYIGVFVSGVVVTVQRRCLRK